MDTDAPPDRGPAISGGGATLGLLFGALFGCTLSVAAIRATLDSDVHPFVFFAVFFGATIGTLGLSLWGAFVGARAFSDAPSGPPASTRVGGERASVAIPGHDTDPVPVLPGAPAVEVEQTR